MTFKQAVLSSAHYMCEPGDATRYRFSVTRTPPLGKGSEIVGDGLGDTDYYLVTVNMSSSTGTFFLSARYLAEVRTATHQALALLDDGKMVDAIHKLSDIIDWQYDYLRTHGAGHLNEYTLVACMIMAAHCPAVTGEGDVPAVMEQGMQAVAKLVGYVTAEVS